MSNKNGTIDIIKLSPTPSFEPYSNQERRVFTTMRVSLLLGIIAYSTALKNCYIARDGSGELVIKTGIPQWTLDSRRHPVVIAEKVPIGRKKEWLVQASGDDRWRTIESVLQLRYNHWLVAPTMEDGKPPIKDIPNAERPKKPL